MRKLPGLTVLLGGGVGVVAITALLAQPAGVSPGRVDGFSQVEARCPTFSWAAVPDADEYVVVVYELAGAGRSGAAIVAASDLRPVLERSFPGNVYSWTPDLDSCLAPAGRHAWVVQSRVDGKVEQSEPRFFHITEPIAIEDQVEAAVRRLVESGTPLVPPGSVHPAIAPDQRRIERQHAGSDSANLTHGPGLGIDSDGTVKANAYLFKCESTAPAFLDADMDTFGDPDQAVEACVPPAGYVADGDDCDDTDDTVVPGTTRPCYSGPNGTEGVGVCTGGTETCSGGTFGSCVGEVVPMAELCNDLDDNCDGVTDEGNPEGGGACNTGLPGICEHGTLVCQGGGLSCAQNNQPTPEDCFDGVDNDCDALTDAADPDCA